MDPLRGHHFVAANATCDKVDEDGRREGEITKPDRTTPLTAITAFLPIVVSQNPSVIPVVVDAIPSYLIIATTISDY
jgi:hypothetical protein